MNFKMAINNYLIEREDGRDDCCTVLADGRYYSMEVREGAIRLDGTGHIASIRGGCSRDDFDRAVVRLDAYSVFDKGRERRVLRDIRRSVCGRADSA